MVWDVSLDVGINTICYYAHRILYSCEYKAVNNLPNELEKDKQGGYEICR